MLIFYFLLFTALLIAYIRVKLKGPSLHGLILKSLTTVVLLLAALEVDVATVKDVSLAQLIPIALLFGLLGDIFLDLKLIYKQDNDFYTYAGFIAFIIGHLFYIYHFLINYELSIMAYSIIFGLAGMIVFLVLVTEVPLQMNYGKFRIISAIYAFILSFIVFFSIGSAIAYPNNQLNFFSGGLVLFLLSDLVLSQSYFGKHEKPWMIIANYLLYYGAQFLIVFSLYIK